MQAGKLGIDFERPFSIVANFGLSQFMPTLLEQVGKRYQTIDTLLRRVTAPFTLGKRPLCRLYSRVDIGTVSACEPGPNFTARRIDRINEFTAARRLPGTVDK